MEIFRLNDNPPKCLFISFFSPAGKNLICLKNQRGQAIIELALLMTFLAGILLAMVILHELGLKNTIAIDALRQEMRISMQDNADGPFHKNQVQKNVFVNIPGRMKQYLGRTDFQTNHTIDFYEGSYQGSGKNKYKLRFLYREIELQN